MTDRQISDADLLRRIWELGREATPERLEVELTDVEGLPLGRRRASLRLRAATEARLLMVKVEGPYGVAWYAPTPMGRKAAGLPREPPLGGPPVDEVEPSGRRARARVAPSNRSEYGWEVRPKP